MCLSLRMRMWAAADPAATQRPESRTLVASSLAVCMYVCTYNTAVMIDTGLSFLSPPLPPNLSLRLLPGLDYPG